MQRYDEISQYTTHASTSSTLNLYKCVNTDQAYTVIQYQNTVTNINKNLFWTFGTLVQLSAILEKHIAYIEDVQTAAI